MSSVMTPAESTLRRYDLDWLRVLGTVAVFFFHVTRFFDADGWHVKNETIVPALNYVIGFMSQWIMPLFFVISGASIYWALKPRRVGDFLWARVLRLAVPALLGMFVIAPPQVYIERVTQGGYTGSLLSFYLGPYFQGLYGRGGNFCLTGMHLWYVFWLFLFGLVLLPLFLFFRSRPGQRVVGALAAAFAHPWRIFLLGLLMFVFHGLSEDNGILWTEASWNLMMYLLLLVIGYLFVAEARFGAVIQRVWRGALVAAVVLSVLMFAVWDFSEDVAFWRDALQWLIRTMGAWCWLIAMFGAARAYLSFTNPFLRHTTELVMPYYILHQTVIVGIGFFIRNWELPVLVKYPLLLAISFVVIMALYELAIRRVDVLRVLFGLKAVGRRAVPAKPPVAPARAGR